MASGDSAAFHRKLEELETQWLASSCKSAGRILRQTATNEVERKWAVWIKHCRSGHSRGSMAVPRFCTTYSSVRLDPGFSGSLELEALTLRPDSVLRAATQPHIEQRPELRLKPPNMHLGDVCAAVEGFKEDFREKGG